MIGFSNGNSVFLVVAKVAKKLRNTQTSKKLTCICIGQEDLI